jgi:hypothetical protein
VSLGDTGIAAAPSDDEVPANEGAGAEEEAELRAAAEATLASTRARRTPKRPTHLSPSGRTPAMLPSSGKRSRGVASAAKGDDIYEYYDEAMMAITESARKRRASQKRLDFELYQPQPTRRREAAEEARGIDALLALAEAGDEGEEPEDEEEEEEEEEEEDAGAMPGDADDEDYKVYGGGVRGSRRTPNATPHKGSRSVGQATPRRGAGRAGASPGLRGLGSPGWLGGLGEGDLLGEMSMDGTYLASPAFGGVQLPAGFIPSPQNPMPRLRKRKHPPEKLPPFVSSIKSLFGRRQSLSGAASSLLSVAHLGYPGVSEESTTPQTPLEAALRHALNARARRWCMFEFFYSAIDRPWFMAGGLGDMLSHLGLGGFTKLTRKEWNALRTGLGKPRRLSLKFLREERARLERWRETARAQYQSGVADPMAVAALPRSLGVGQSVTARHPVTRQPHDGSVLTASNNSYRVQFDRRGAWRGAGEGHRCDALRPRREPAAGAAGHAAPHGH